MFSGGHHARTASAMSGVMVERACLVLQSAQEKQARDQAEQFLVSFRSSANPYSVAKHVLDKSVDPSAQFHAVAACREGLLREWGLLETRQIEDLRTELLVFAANRGPSLAPFVVNQLLQCVCVIFKRDFLRNPQTLSSTLLSQLTQLLSSSSEQQKTVAASLCVALVTEFSSSHSSSIGVNMQFHNDCHERFEHLCLPGLTSMLLSSLQAVVHGKVKQDEKQQFLVSLCKALQSVLNWDFTDGGDPQRALSQSWLKENTGKLCPSSEWNVIFVQGPLLDLLATIQANNRSNDAVRDCIVQCCCLQGVIFDMCPRPTKLQYFTRLISRCIDPIISSPTSSNEVLAAEKKDGSTMLKRLMENPAFDISTLLSLPENVKFILHFAQHICNVIRVGVEMLEAINIGLDAWCRLLIVVNKSAQAELLGKFPIVQLSSVIFKHYVEWRVAAGDEEEEMEDLVHQLGSAGKIGRVDAQMTITWLRDLIAQRAAALANKLPPTELPRAQMQLKWLLSVLQHFLCDYREANEKVGFPPELLQLALSSNQPEANPIIDIIKVIRSTGSLLFHCPETTQGQQGARLLRAYVDVLRCLAYVYLVPAGEQFQTGKPASAQKYGILSNLYGEGTAGHAEMFQFIVASLASCLVNVHQEVREGAVEMLEEMIDYSASVCTSTVSSAAWWLVLQAVEKVSLSTDLLKRLATAVCVGCAEGNAKVPKTDARFREGLLQLLVRPMSHKLEKLLSSAKISIAILPEFTSVVSIARGMVCASANRNAYPLLAQFVSSFLPYVVMALSRQTLPQAVLLLLQLVQATAESSVPFFKEDQMWKFCELLLQSIDAWAAFNSRRVQSSETEGEQANEIESLLISLAGVVCKEAVDKSGENFARPIFPSEFTLLALNHLLPSFTTSLLLFPVVITNYFEILEVIIQVHPELFAAMEGPARATMIESAKFAIRSNSEVVVIESGLCIVRSIACFHYEALQHSTTTPFHADAQSLLRCLVELVMFEKLTASLVNPLADALLPMLLLNAPGFMSMVLEGFRERVDIETQLKLGLTQLTKGVTRTLAVENQTQFQAALLTFVLLVRSLVQTK